MNNDLEQFSEERLKELADFAMAGAIEVVELARIALAAKQAKPIGYFVHTLEDGVRGMTSIPDDSPLVKVATPLYTTPQPAHTEQDGWMLVPIEPTEDMLKAGCRFASEHNTKGSWSQMLAAAPKPESEG